MRRALELAEQGRGRVSPNPLVGAVVVKDGCIAGEGFHAACGAAHAEAAALEQAGENARGAELYVTLEPCNHKGRTGKCTEKILEAGICRVIIGMPDPNPDVEGGGADFLKNRGVEVVTGLLEQEARFQNRYFITSAVSKRPYVILKWAMSLDGYTGTRTGDSTWISCTESRRAVHALRNYVDGVCVGAATVCTDDPLLTCRDIPGGRDPVRIILDPRLRTPADARLFSSDAPLIFIVKKGASSRICADFRQKGAECMEVPFSENRIDLKAMLASLYEKGITSMLVEGGGITSGSFVEAKLADEVLVFCAPCLIGGEGVKPVQGRGIESMDQRVNVTDIRISRYSDDMCVQGRIEYPE